ncbi:MAG TPA: dihydrofolate reductase family protein [Acidimicrobiales bacterium]|nr:dihydrofolate reductase family protein [Acidimicrobiales bacterium]
MGQVAVDITMSLDGFVTAPNDRLGCGLGDAGEVLHYWVFGREWSYENREGLDRRLGTSSGVDKEVLEEAMGTAGAVVVGRRMYDVTGGWGGRSPFGPCIVVTHRPEDQPDPASGFQFIVGVTAAVARAREISAERPVVIGGGASIVQQALKAELVDELQIHIAPVILGAGRPLFGELGRRVRLERLRVIDSRFATHVKYGIVGKTRAPDQQDG